MHLFESSDRNFLHSPLVENSQLIEITCDQIIIYGD